MIKQVLQEDVSVTLWSLSNASRMNQLDRQKKDTSTCLVVSWLFRIPPRSLLILVLASNIKQTCGSSTCFQISGIDWKVMEYHESWDRSTSGIKPLSSRILLLNRSSSMICVSRSTILSSQTYLMRAKPFRFLALAQATRWLLLVSQTITFWFSVV